MKIGQVVVTCEHAGNNVPRAFADLFASRQARRALASHRGYDPGALRAARFLARQLGAPLLTCATTRLLVEVNRSEGHRRLFSEFTRGSSSVRRDAMRRRHYLPHRARVAAAIAAARRAGAPVLHLGVHSFAARIGTEVRNADVGLLYDPARRLERALCQRWQRALERDGSLRVRRNYPYRGSSDGLTTALRRRFPAGAYLGIELEINQDTLTGRNVRHAVSTLRALVRGLVGADRGVGA